MGAAIGESLPAAVGIALSPFPIIAVVLVLVTPRGKADSLAFVGGWIAGLVLVGLIALAIASGTTDSEDGHPANWVNVLKLVLGVILLMLALRQWEGRPKGDEVPPMPKWMQTLDSFTPLKAAGFGVLMSALNPKNLLLAVAGAAAIAGAGVSAGQEAIAYAVFVIVGSIGVAAPVVITFAMGDRAGAILDELKDWLVKSNAVIMVVLLLLIGVKLVGDALTGFSG
jgi:threonine/homoserine/homoserine lactone efflux protein